MPTLARFGSTRLMMFSNDHPPPHFHLFAPDFEVQIRLSDLSPIAGSARSTKIAEPLVWAEANRATLQATWAELNDR